MGVFELTVPPRDHDQAQRIRIETLSGEVAQQVTQGSSITDALQSQTDSQDRIESNISALKHASLQSYHDTQQALLILSQKVDELPSLSTEQFETIRTISGRLQNQVGGMLTGQLSSTIPETQISPSHALRSEDNSVESGLEDFRYSHKRNLSKSIQNLCQLAKLKPKTASSEMAQSIIYDLEQLLNAASRAASETEATQRRSGAYEITYLGQVEQEVKLMRDIARTRGLLNASFDVEINRKGQPLRTSIHLSSHPFLSVYTWSSRRSSSQRSSGEILH